MKEFKKILFPVDFSEVSPKIAPWVLSVGKTYNAEIHLLFVVRKLEYFSSMDVGYIAIKGFEDEVVAGAESSMEKFINENFQDCPACTSKVVLGDAAEEILSYTESEKMDIIVMGTHGRKGLERIIFGSVAERVIKMAPVPVLSINPYRMG